MTRSCLFACGGWPTHRLPLCIPFPVIPVVFRWAYEDQNPRARADKVEEQQHAVLTAAERRGIFGDEGNKRPRKDESCTDAHG